MSLVISQDDIITFSQQKRIHTSGNRNTEVVESLFPPILILHYDLHCLNLRACYSFKIKSLLHIFSFMLGIFTNFVYNSAITLTGHYFLYKYQSLATCLASSGISFGKSNSI